MSGLSPEGKPIVVVLTDTQWQTIQDALEHPSHLSAEVIGAILDQGREGHYAAVVVR